MRIAPLADVKARLSAYLEQCETEGPVVITRNGKAVAVLLAPMNDEDLEGLLLARSPRFQALLPNREKALRQAKDFLPGTSGKLWPPALAEARSQTGIRAYTR